MNWKTRTFSFAGLTVWACFAANPLLGADASSQGVVTAAVDDGSWGEESTEAQFAALQQETQPPPATETRRPTTRRTTRSSPSNLRLASVPKMFGDVHFNGAQVFFVSRARDANLPTIGTFDLPLAGGARRLKIGENNSPLPEDRVVFLYNHFHNAIQTIENPPGAPPIMNSTHVDRYTFGIEKTYWDEMASLEVRMPIVSSFDHVAINGSTIIDGGDVGNLALILKYLLYAEESWALGAGMAIDLPTGSNTTLRTNDTFFTVQNEAVHLLPYVGVVASPDDRWFTQSFAQLDFATEGNPVTGTGLPADLRYNDQNLLYLDTMIGFWLLRDPSAPVLTGIAAISELHYTTTIQDTDVVQFVQTSPASGAPIVAAAISNPFNRIDVINLTAGLNLELGNTTSTRVAAVVPLEDGIDERFFDAEFQVQVNRRY